jgi:uncharacterized lipoprotein YmbA
MFLALLMPAIVVTGCAHTAPTRFYALTAVAPEAPSEQAQTGPSVSVGPVRVAAYLDRQHIVTRADGGELLLAEFDRWAEPLGEGISRVLAENLSRLLSSEQVYGRSFRPSGSVDFRVAVSVLAFEVEPAARLVLRAQWQVVGGDGKTVVASGRTSLRDAVPEKGVGAIVSAQSHALAALSREIAEAVRDN